jgi:primosomal protein N'
MIRVIINGADLLEVKEAAIAIGEELKVLLGEEHVFGAAPAPWEKIKDRFRWIVLLRGTDLTLLRHHLIETLYKTKKNWGKRIYAQIDVDPYSFM